MKKWAAVISVLSMMFATIAFSGSVPDTGQDKCYDNTGRIPCPLPGEPFYGQDAQYVRARSYTKLDENGTALPDNATSWVMVKDNVTGLIWEVKNAKDGTKDYTNPHDADNTYTWYDPDFAEYPGTPGDGTDTQDFIDKLNANSFGGYSDWRMPTIKELQAIVDRGRESSPFINVMYFPNTQGSYYWSGSSDAGGLGSAWYVDFGNGDTYFYGKLNAFYVRGVRSGQ